MTDENYAYLCKHWDMVKTALDKNAGRGFYFFTNNALYMRMFAPKIAKLFALGAEFTRQRLEEIRQVEEEIRICEGCLRFWQEPLGTEYGGVVPMRRILAREKATLAELKRGMKEETQ